MSSGDVIRPFRWDITQRSQLGSLPDLDAPETYREFENDLLTCRARLLALAGDSDLVFVGRSPHAIFDLLSGLLLDTSWSDRLGLLNVSLTYSSTAEEERSLAPYLAAVGLDPQILARRGRVAALVDVVDTGATFTALIRILSSWAERERVEWDRVARRLRIVGLTWREQTSPKTWRWHQHADWVNGRRPGSIKNVSLPYRLARSSPPARPRPAGRTPPAGGGSGRDRAVAQRRGARGGCARAPTVRSRT